MFRYFGGKTLVGLRSEKDTVEVDLGRMGSTGLIAGENEYPMNQIQKHIELEPMQDLQQKAPGKIIFNDHCFHYYLLST
jgi:hypothetical protein